MKQRYNALDLKAAVAGLNSELVGCRVSNVYDIDSKTYLIKLAKQDKKGMILIESGIRIHETEFEWPKNVIPSGFSMKLRKHIRSRRLESISQLGADRIVDLQFGSNEAAYHLIAELYDRGNILLTDFEYTIIAVLRPRTDQEADVKFTVREKYPLDLVRQNEKLTLEKLEQMIANKPNEDLKKILTSSLTFGGPLIDHCLSVANFSDKITIGKNFDPVQDIQKLFDSLVVAEDIYNSIGLTSSKGYIIQKKTKSVKLDSDKNIQESEEITFEEFHPFLFKKYETSLFIEYASFNKAVDEFFSKLESQKLEVKQSNQTKEAIKKLENVKKDHQKRLEELKQSQSEDELKAILIQHNLDLVDNAIYLVNSALARKLDWPEIKELIDEAKEEEHPVACAIKNLKLEVNHIVLDLEIPDEDEQSVVKRDVEVDLGLNAFKNSTKYYESKKYSLQKEKKTLDASDKALKNAEKRTIELLKQSSSSTKKGEITKSRKIYWFEKFYWFISSENYLVIGGRDQQQNEIVVKRYLKPGDLYVHADIQGASSVIIKNPSNKPVPPKTLNEAGCMAVCYSVAWEAKVLTNAYWVYHNQVSKQAPTGEYLTTGSFMIRGKKNFIPQTALVFGFGILYKLEESSVARHKNDRVVKTNEESGVGGEDEMKEDIGEDSQSQAASACANSDGATEEQDDDEEEEEVLSSDDDEDKGLFPDTSLQIKLVSNIKLEETVKEVKEEEEEEETVSATKGNENIDSKSSESENEEATDEREKEDEHEGQCEDKKDVDTEPKKASKSEHGAKMADKSSKDNKSSKSSKTSGDNKNTAAQSAQQSHFKRGQKTRYNKMKNKYKDQDDDDRELIMQYLGSAGKSKAAAKAEQQQQKQQHQQSKGSSKQKPPPIKSQQTSEKPRQSNEDSEAKTSKQIDEQSDGEDDANETAEDEIGAVIDSLTGVPLDEDELLYCLPVCAPYTTLNSYKHKVKLIPGTTKRGQAIKTAMQIFMKEKGTTERERNMFKANLLNKEQDITRNLPGKVKVSAPNLMKLKKK